MISTRTLTLIFALSLLLTVVFPVADAHINTPPARRSVPPGHRMLKKRAPAPPTNIQGIDNAAGAEQPPARGGFPPGSDPTIATASSASGATPTQATATTNIPLRNGPLTAPTATPVDPTTTDAGLVPGLVSELTSGSSSAPSPSNSSLTLVSSSSTTSSSSSTSSVTSTSLSTPTPVLSTAPLSQVTITTSSTESPTPTAATSGKTVTTLQRNTIIVLIAIGASIGAAGLIWTIIRKWKFRPSSSFEDRMQPIDWQPTTTTGERDMTERLGRSASTASHGSFTSGNNHDNHLVPDLPQHDFTAGAANLAPVGGYADLQRGPSPQPDYHGGPNYRSPSPYHYDIPNHSMYNAGGYQGGYDHNRGY